MKEKELPKIWELKETKSRERYGCDFCKKDKATEKFIGFTGNVLWFCTECFNKLTSQSEAKKNEGQARAR